MELSSVENEEEVHPDDSIEILESDTQKVDDDERIENPYITRAGRKVKPKKIFSP
ncbi:hypothetical protein DPMN_050341 [Dreissena polymorpha]|uniref:Uncharacterized protein n=1 Tax=Dreissena polymorpha TaxID=45954 RepID=A0A9D4CHC0_DREPO|nr:hypothetical protein DPMN_050341 [Dreissena polymorpha]